MQAAWYTLIVVLALFFTFVIISIVNRKFRVDLLTGSPAEVRFLGFLNVGGLALVVIMGILVGAALWLDNIIGNREPPLSATDSGTRVIRQFFAKLNAGIASNEASGLGINAASGENKQFDAAWNLLTPNLQDRKVMAFPALHLPRDFWVLYKGSGYHTVVSVVPITVTQDGNYAQFFVIFSLKEAVVANPIFDLFFPASGNSKTLQDIPTSSEVSRLVSDALKKNYTIDQQTLANIQADLKKEFLNRVVSSRLVGELAAGRNLVRAIAPAHPETDGENFYGVYEGDRALLQRIDGEWRIDKFVMESLFSETLASNQLE